MLLAFMLGDGPYWHSALEILGPPKGASFYRRFNYRTDWVHDDLLGRISDGGTLGPIKGVLGMRFGQANPEAPQHQGGPGPIPLFVPLRIADQALVVREGDLGVELVLGEYVRLDAGTNDFRALTIPQAQHLKNASPVLLRLSTDEELAAIPSWDTSALPDHRIWSRLADSDVLPEHVRGIFRDHVVLYCTGARDLRSGTALSPIRIDRRTPHDRLATRGYRLALNRTYRLNLETRRIGAPGQQVFPRAPDFSLLNEEDVVRASSRIVPFTGNYREVSVWIRPTRHQPVPLDLWWHPREHEGLNVQVPSPNVGLRIAFRTRRLFPLRQVLLALILLAFGAISYVSAFAAQPTRSQAAVLVALGTLLVTGGVAELREAVTRWESHG